MKYATNIIVPKRKEARLVLRIFTCGPFFRQDTLSKQPHYEFGLRSIKSVLELADSNKPVQQEVHLKPYCFNLDVDSMFSKISNRKHKKFQHTYSWKIYITYIYSIFLPIMSNKIRYHIFVLKTSCNKPDIHIFMFQFVCLQSN